jgi:hypothetical protein
MRNLISKNLGLLTKDLLGHPKGLVKLETVDGVPAIPLTVVGDKLNHNRISVEGPIQVYPNTQVVYTIINYDNFTNYTVTAINGSVDSINGPEITYTTPTTVGECGFTINGQKILLNIAAVVYVKKPTIIYPANNNIDLGPDVFIQTSPFQTIGDDDTHQSTDYQIAEDILFQTGLQTLNNQILGRTSIVIPNLIADKIYYVRARHRGDILSVSSWSDPHSFTTKNEYKPNKPSILSPMNAQEGVGPILTTTSSAYNLTDSSSSSLSFIEWQLSTSIDFTNILQPSTTVGLNAVWNIINYNTVFYLRMRHISNISIIPSEWSDTVSFLSGAIPVPNTPTITALIGQQDIALTFNADGYHSDIGEPHVSSTWQISLDSAFTNIISSKSVTDSTTFLTWYGVSGLDLDTTYYVRVSYKSNQGRESIFSTPVNFTTLSNLINTPSITLVSGFDPYINVSASSYQGSNSSGNVSRIHWQVYGNADFTTGVLYDSEDIYDGSVNAALSGLYAPYGSAYYVRMRYKSVNGFYSMFSTPILTDVKNYMSAPVLGSASVTAFTSNCVFTWFRGTNTIPGVNTTFTFKISQTLDFSNNVTVVNNIQVNDTMLTMPLSYDNTYYWKIEQTDTDTISGYTETKVSSVGIVAVGSESSVSYGLYSTPAFSVNEGGDVIFTLTKSHPNNISDFFTLSGSAGNNNDINHPLSGSLTFNNQINSQVDVTIPIISDILTDGNKTLTFEWRTNSINGTIVASSSVTVTDTSLSPNPFISTPSLTVISGHTGPYVSLSANQYSGNSTSGNALNAVWVVSTDPTLATNIVLNETVSYNGSGPAVLENKYLPANTVYYISVKYISDNGTQSNISNIVSITTQPAYMLLPNMLYPTSGQQNLPVSFSFDWSEGSYVFQNLNSINFELFVVEDLLPNTVKVNQSTGSTTGMTVSNLNYDTSYLWRVRQTVIDQTVIGSPVTLTTETVLVDNQFRTMVPNVYTVGLAVIDTSSTDANGYITVTGHFVMQNPGDMIYALSIPHSDNACKFAACSPGAENTVQATDYYNTGDIFSHIKTLFNGSTQSNLVNSFGLDGQSYSLQVTKALINNNHNPGGAASFGQGTANLNVILNSNGTFIYYDGPWIDPGNPVIDGGE